MSADLKKIVKAVQDYENARVAFEKAKQYLEDLVDPPKVTGAACGQQDYQWRLHEAQRSEMIAQQGQLGAIRGGQ